MPFKVLALSLLIHGAVLPILFTLAPVHTARRDPPFNSKPASISFAVVKPKNQRRAQPTSRTHRPNVFRLRKFSAWTPPDPLNKPAVKVDAVLGSTTSRFDSSAFGGAFEGDMFYKILWRDIDQSTGYPDDFANQRIEGKVHVKLVVDRTGVFQRFVDLGGNDWMLELYVSAVLLHCLRQPLAHRFWLAGRNEITIDAIFDFETYGEIGNPPSKARMGTLKNYFYFQKLAYVEPKLNHMINKFFTKYYPPIVPIPGGFYVDVVRSYEMIQNWNKEDPDQKGLERLRSMARILQANTHKALPPVRAGN